MDQEQQPTTGPVTPPISPSLGMLERLMTWLYDIRLWFTTAARVGQLMARGGYLIGERRRLFVKLGEMVYEKNQRREGDAAAAAQNAERLARTQTTASAEHNNDQQLPAEPERTEEDAEEAAINQLIHQIDRLTKKLEIEEMLIRSARFGVKTERPYRTGVTGTEAGRNGE